MVKREICYKNRYMYFCTLISSISIIICLLPTQSCTSKKESIKKQEIIIQKSEEEKKKNEEKQRIKIIIEQDSIAEISLIQKYKALSEVDTLYQLFSFKLREVLAKHLNLVGFKGEILDIDQNNTKNIVTIELWGIDGIGKFYCNSETFQRLILKSGIERGWGSGIFIVKVSDFIPVYSELTKRIDKISLSPSEESFTQDDLIDYVNINISTPIFPYYIFHGELIDFDL